MALIRHKRLIIGILLVFSLSGCEAIINFFAFFPDKRNVLDSDALPAGVQEVEILQQDGPKLVALYLAAADSNKVVIYFHGNAGNIYHRLETLLKLKEMGVNVLGVSYRGYGKSEGKPNEKGFYQDGLSAYDYVTESLGFSAEQIILMGRSIGSTVAVNTAQNRNIHQLLLVSPLFSASEQAKSMGLGWFSFVAKGVFDNAAKIQQINSPLLVIHGSRDEVIPYSSGVKLFEKAPNPKKLVTIEGAGHNNLQGRFYNQYWSAIEQFLTTQSYKK